VKWTITSDATHEMTATNLLLDIPSIELCIFQIPLPTQYSRSSSRAERQQDHDVVTAVSENLEVQLLIIINFNSF
jgi:hypothetical protein